jgi:hypothetical protein
MSSIAAAVMPAPRVPRELRKFDEPALETVPWRAIGERPSRRIETKQARADAGAIRLPKARVQPI